jgi:hypothetical protein
LDYDTRYVYVDYLESVFSAATGRELVYIRVRAYLVDRVLRYSRETDSEAVYGKVHEKIEPHADPYRRYSIADSIDNVDDVHITNTGRIVIRSDKTLLVNARNREWTVLDVGVVWMRSSCANMPLCYIVES